jgi:hypothetical protein
MCVNQLVIILSFVLGIKIKMQPRLITYFKYLSCSLVHLPFLEWFRIEIKWEKCYRYNKEKHGNFN